MTASPARPDAAANVTDIISALAGVQPDSALAQLRAERPEATEHAQGSYAALFDPAEVIGLTQAERFATALRVATLHAADGAIAHYRSRLIQAGGSAEEVQAAEQGAATASSPRLRAILSHAELLGTHPVDASPDALQQLSDAGLSTLEVVVLSQIIAFISFQLRVITGLQLLAGGGTPDAATVATADPVVREVTPSPQTANAANILRPAADLKRPPVFTRDQLGWAPWLEPLDLADATPAQLAALEGRRGNSPYFRLLALDPQVLSERTATDLGIFYTHGGAPRADRELAAAATSRLNGCIFCASVHARTAAQLSKREEDVDRLLDKGISDIPSLELGERWQAVVELAVALAATPSVATEVHVARLREIGLAELEILDVIQAAAFFSWANRLMLTIGEPYYEEAAG